MKHARVVEIQETPGKTVTIREVCHQDAWAATILGKLIPALLCVDGI